MRHVSGITGAAPILHDAAMAVEKRFPSTGFRMPADIREVEVCPDSGQVPGLKCPGRVLGVYKREFLPKGPCEIHRSLMKGETSSHIKRLKIKFPQDGDIFKIDPSTPGGAQGLNFQTNGAPGAENVLWKVDGKLLEGQGEDVWWHLSTGWHRLDMGVAKNGIWTRIHSVGFRVLK
jgi:penicillin-binding protein 1C